MFVVKLRKLRSSNSSGCAAKKGQDSVSLKLPEKTTRKAYSNVSDVFRASCPWRCSYKNTTYPECCATFNLCHAPEMLGF